MAFWHARHGTALFLLVCMAARLSAADERPNTPDPLLVDAELADVSFVNRHTGWAVGDRGAIWHTRDGGATWRWQDSHIRCRLNSVFFLDEVNGWAAGGSTQPYTHLSQGALVHTSDGGQTWSAWPLVLPAIQRLKFFDKRHGVAIGATSALHPVGVLVSDDGGHTWAPMSAERGEAWRSGDFTNQATGALAGHAGALAAVRNKSVVPLDGIVGLRQTRCVQLTDSGGWLVQDGGAVLTTRDVGQTWQPAAAPIDSLVSDMFDLGAIAVHGPHCWVAGAPGSRVFHTADGGRTWDAQATGNLVPIRSLAFVDAEYGWAVGALGTILATRDGGQSWQRQRSGGARAALAGFYSEPNQVPLELFAQLSAADGHLGVVHIAGRRDLDQQTGAELDLAERTHETLVAAGACGAETAWRFPLRQAGLDLPADQLIAALNRAHDGRGLEKFEADLVCRLRTWRPDVVFTHHASPQGDDPLGFLIHQLVVQAVEQAADPASYAELATQAGLAPWQVKKVFATARGGEKGAVSINTVRLEPRLGCSIADRAATAAGILRRHYEPPAAEIGFQLLHDHIPQQRGQKNIFSGIALNPGGEARRVLGEPAFEAIEELRRATQKQRNMQELIRRSQNDRTANANWQGQLDDLTRDMPPDGAARNLYQLASQYSTTGSWELAAATFEALVKKHPQHPLSAPAQQWLIDYYGSGEVAWRLRQQPAAVALQVGGASDSTRDIQAGGLPPLATAATRSTEGESSQAAKQRLTKAAELGQRLERAQTALWAEPRVQFPLIAVERQLGWASQAERALQNLRRNRPLDAWSLAALAEQWLAKRQGRPPKPVWHVKAASEKPRLDGKLNDTMWQAAQPVNLQSTLRDDGDWPAAARLAYDHQFIYIGIECRRAAGAKYPQPQGVRPRDADLAGRDRVELLLDIDRDYSTFYRLVIDHRGWTADDCFGDTGWNPAWYVAAQTDEGSWTAEAAIPLAELTGEPPTAGQAWSVGVQRIVPGVGFQSWNQPASTAIEPAGFGLLLFE